MSLTDIHFLTCNRSTSGKNSRQAFQLFTLAALKGNLHIISLVSADMYVNYKYLQGGGKVHVVGDWKENLQG